MIQLDRLTPHQRLKILGEFLLPRHGRPVDQHRHHPYITCKCCAGFQPNEIMGIVQASPAGSVLGIKPLVADQNNQYLARSDRPFDGLYEVGSRLYSLNIHEDDVGTEVCHQTIVKPARVAGGVVSSVADENTFQNLPLCSNGHLCR